MIKIIHAIIVSAVSIAFIAEADAQIEVKPADVSGYLKPAVSVIKIDKFGSMPEAETKSAASGAAPLELAKTHNCFTCHAIDRKVIGPAWQDVSARYRGDASAEESLVKKISGGGKGVWGKDMAMPPFAPFVSETDIRALVKYVLSLK